MLELMLGSKLGQLRKCGTVKKPTRYKVTLLPDGRVTAAAATGRNKPTATVDSCIRVLLQSLQLPPFRGKATRLTITLP